MTGNYLRNMAKADLHVHLNGAVPTPVLRELIRRHQCDLPDGFDCKTDLQVLTPVASLRDYFRPWFAIKQLPKGRDCLRTMVHAAVENLRQDGVVYVELRNSPFNIAHLNAISLHETVDWLAEAAATAETQTGTKVRLVLSVSRYKFNMSAGIALLQAIGDADGRPYIVGFDLSGDETQPLPDEAHILFRRAKDELGLGITIHAGETGNADNIEWAIRKCKADRIGHGSAVVRSPRTAEFVAESGVCLEVCLHSNLRTGQVDSLANHHVTQLIELNIPFVLCSDNPAVHGADLSDDYQAFLDVTARPEILASMFDHQCRYAFGRN